MGRGKTEGILMSNVPSNVPASIASTPAVNVAPTEANATIMSSASPYGVR